MTKNKQVQDDVQDACRRQIGQGPLRVAAGAQDGVAKVENAERRHAERVNAEIEHCAGQQIVFRLQQFQNRRGQEKAKNRDHDAGQRTQNQRRVDAISRVFFLTCAEILRYADIDAIGKPNQKACKQRDER